MDTYDQHVYAIGKGPTSMTVTAPDVAAAFGTPVVIKGTVMDVSPGTQDDNAKLRFPNGIPAVSDGNMSDWMLYVYKQFQQPTNIVGLPISIDAMGSNNNYVHLGDTTSDASGSFSLMVTPENSGKYTIYATFAGSKSYYASFAQTAMGVQEVVQPTATPTATPPQQSSTDMYLAASTIAIIIAIAVAIVILRKRP